MDVDKILKAIRVELNISQETLARDLNVSYASLNRWENKKTKPSRLAKIQIRDYCVQKKISKDIISNLERV